MVLAPKPLISVQVRELVEFALRTGDLGGHRDFVGSRRALEGIRGHQRLQKTRPAGYQREVRLIHEVDDADFTLRIQGRIDGLLETETEVLIEEIKTVQGRWNGVADPLHWAQAKIYGFIYAREHAREQITLRLAYLDLETGKVTEFLERASFDDLSAFFDAAITIYLEWIREQQQWRRTRDQSILPLEFPFQQYRPGQREIAVAVYRAVTRQRKLYVEAPTGIGKTMAVLFPALKAMAEGKVDRVFYLTARTTARAVAEKALADLRESGLRARTLTLTAKDKLCVQDGQPCDPELCPLARGYFDRRKAAMRAALAREEISRSVLEQVAQQDQVCPFELSLDLSMWVDAVVCDYNYVFDPRVYLRRHFAEENGNYALLIDEAHNLVDRARSMFSADIRTTELLEARRAIQRAAPSCARALTKLSAAIKNLDRPADSIQEPVEIDASSIELNLFPPATQVVEASPWSQNRRKSHDIPGEARTIRDFPSHLLPLLEEALHQAEKWLLRNEATPFRPDLLALYFRLSFFCRTSERYDERYRTILVHREDSQLTLFCLDPSFLLREALARAKSAIFFSATLSPSAYYRELLGGGPDDPVLQLPSPFPSHNLAVLVQDRIRTHFKARQTTLQEVAEAVETLVRERPGNYFVYLPSYQYLASLRELFEQRCPDLTVLTQRPGMSDAERDTFLDAFAVDNPHTQVGFAVMGGVFGEGVDLVGDRLIGAVIVGVGLPQLCVERDLIDQYFQEKIGAGFDYAYAFPGINRVLQATGRVIRSESDRGAVLLIDARFGEQRYQRLLPRWWQTVRVRSLEQIREVLRPFWKSE